MDRKIVFDDSYYAERAHEEAPWLIRNAEHRVIGHYNPKVGLSWGALMLEADKEWLQNLIQLKLGNN